MFCEKCGTKLEKDAKFCEKCGKRVNDNFVGLSSEITAPMVDAKFYSEDWRRMKVFAIASLPYFDVMADKDNLYLIELPKYNFTTLIFFFGLIGSFIGGSIDAKKRRNYRSTWLTSDHKIISRDYDKDIFLKIPLKNLKDNLVFKRNKFILTSSDQKITLKKNSKECKRFSEFIKRYVL